MYRKFSKWLLFFVSLVTMLAVWQASNITFRYDFDQFFPKDDQGLRFFEEHRARFGSDNGYVLVALESHHGVFNQEFLSKVSAITDTIQGYAHCKKVVSPTNLEFVVDGVAGPLSIKAISFDPSQWKNDSVYIFQQPDMLGSFFSVDGKAVTIFIQLEEGLQRDASNALISKIDVLLEQSGLEYHFSGKAKAEHTYIGKMQHELVFFVFCSFMLVLMFLYITYRSFWGVIMPLLVILISVIWTLGFMGFMGYHFDLLTVLVPSILFVVGMSDVIHMMSKYIELLRNGYRKDEAVDAIIKEVGLATFLTSFTTGVGFLTLLTLSVQPIRDFGVITAVGVMLAFVITYAFLPPMLLVLPLPKVVNNVTKQGYWDKKVAHMLSWLFANRKWILAVSGCIFIISLIGISKIRVNASLVDEVSSREKLKQDFRFFEDKFLGVRPFELSIEMKGDAKVFDYDVLLEMSLIEKYALQTYGIKQIQSPLSIVRSVNRAKHGGDPTYYTLPSTEEEYTSLKRYISKASKTSMASTLATKDQRWARFSARMVDAGSAQTEAKNQAFNTFIQQQSFKYCKPVITGSALLIDKSNNLVTYSMIQGLLFSFLVITVIMGLMYRSIIIIAIALAVNILPLMMVAAIMGYAGIDLKLSTSIIFTIAFGIAVDDTIHFLSKLRMELSTNKSLMYAVKRTFLSTGKAIIVTSIVLVAGFLFLMLSSFKGTFYTGLLVSLTLLFAVIADLFLAPVLLLYFYKKR